SAVDAELLPHGINSRLDTCIHGDGLAPFALGFARPLVGGIQSHFGTKAGNGRSEIKIVDGCVVDHHRIANGVHPGRHGPDHIFPVSSVDVIIGDDNKLGVHELSKEGPHAHHHALGMTGILFAYSHHRHAVGTTL